MMRSAGFSDDRVYRYWLARAWNPVRPTLVVIGLNPSTADETADDPTIRRCLGYARTWGLGSLIMLNLFAFRATDPRVMRAAPDPVGPENDAALLRHTGSEGALILCAWGTHGALRDRGAEVTAKLREWGRWPYALGVTKDGHPRHPLYLRADATAEPYGWAELARQEAV